MRKFLGLAVILSMVCAITFAQEKTTVQKPATTAPVKVQGAEKAVKDDCCSGEKVKEQAEGCGAGCGDCTDKPKSTSKTKSAAGATKVKTTADKTPMDKTTTAPKAK